MGAQKRTISISKNVLETSRQIFTIFSAFWGGHSFDTLWKMWREFDGVLGEGVKFDASE